MIPEHGIALDAAGNELGLSAPGHLLLNFNDPNMVSAYVKYLQDLDRPIRFDVLETNFHYHNDTIDLDRNGNPDQREHGLAWIDEAQFSGALSAINAAKAGNPYIGNGSWMPAGNDKSSPFGMTLDGTMVEFYPLATWRDPSDGRWKPSVRESMNWHVEQALVRREPSIFMADDHLHENSYFRQYVDGPNQATRLALAAALLTDGWLGLGRTYWPRWCDECGVVNCTTSTAYGSGNWLGSPLGPPSQSEGVWHRSFRGGEVFLNTTSVDETVSFFDPTMKTLRGWYDVVYNAGGSWNGYLPAYNARILCRTQPPPDPTEMPTPTDTATPTMTPTPTPTRTVIPLETRVSVIEGALQCAVDCLVTPEP
jgi:hypothetical protein